MDFVKHGLLDGDLPRRVYVHRLSYVHSYESVFTRIHALYAQGVVFAIKNKALNFQSERNGLFLVGGVLRSFLLHSPRAGACNLVTDIQQIVDIPHVVRIRVKVYSNRKYFSLLVNNLL